jgi:hypothetical protein
MNIMFNLYQATLRLLPYDFRARYGAEMTEIARERCAEDGMRGLFSECGSVLLTAARLRLQPAPVQVAALVVMASMILIARAQHASPGDQDFAATDPAGDFTLMVRDGRAVAGTIDRQPLASNQLVHAGDSIRVLARSGRVLFAVAYDRKTSSIAWEPRPARCRGHALDCEAYQ